MAKEGRPIKINGITITPKWDWGKDFERHVKADIRRVYGPSIVAVPTTCPMPFGKRKERHQEESYRQWLRDQGRDPDSTINRQRHAAERPILAAENDGVSVLQHWR